MNCIVAPCYTTVPCPQRKRKPKICKELVVPWAESVASCGLHGIVVYDELPEEIMAACPQGIGFRKVPAPPGGMSVNDGRIYVYRDLMAKMDFIEAVFFTDLFDVIVQHDPFPWLQEKGGLAVGTEGDPIQKGPWMSGKMRAAFGNGWTEIVPGTLPRCTGCLFGGVRESVVPFLDIMCGILSGIHASHQRLNANMPALQMAVHAGMCGHRVHFGHPLHHPRWRFGKRDQDAFFHHEWRGLKSPLFT